MKLIKDQDITITLLRNSQNEHAGYWAIAHFQARVNHTDVAICSPDGKGAVSDIQECKFKKSSVRDRRTNFLGL